VSGGTSRGTSWSRRARQSGRLAQAFTPKGKDSPSAGLSLAGLAAALLSVWLLATGSGRGSVMAGAVAADELSLFLHALVLGVAAISVLLSPSYLRANGMERGEYYALLLFAVVGMLGLVSSLELVSIFVALEIMSIALYGMAGMDRRRVESQEAALKYFVTGAFASAFFLYGVALLYGVTGSTSLDKVARATGVLSFTAMPPSASSALALLGAALLLVGFAFKVGSVPFHMWVPDVYEGAPTTTTAFMAAGVKAAAFGALLRVFDSALPALASQWQPLVAVLAIVTMVVGNLAALAQSNLKRMLAYSSIAHAGYLLTALVAAPLLAGEAVLFYLVAYAAVNLGAFGTIAALSRDGREPLSLPDVAGLAERRPPLAAASSGRASVGESPRAPRAACSRLPRQAAVRFARWVPAPEVNREQGLQGLEGSRQPVRGTCVRCDLSSCILLMEVTMSISSTNAVACARSAPRPA
jgi:NADH-quinone oxidoreductase subunit N